MVDKEIKSQLKTQNSKLNIAIEESHTPPMKKPTLIAQLSQH